MPPPCQPESDERTMSSNLAYRSLVRDVPIFLVLRSGVEDGKLSGAIILESQYTCEIAAPVAVVGCGPDGHKLFVEHVFISFLYELVCSSDQVESVDSIELQDG